MKISFLKMHGTGNDFVVLDGRAQGIALSREQVVRLADRHFGIGCDQLVVLHPSSSPLEGEPKSKERQRRGDSVGGKDGAALLGGANGNAVTPHQNCDAVLAPPQGGSKGKAEAAMRIYNADGSEISTCGNATRCVADMLMRESGKSEAVIETKAGIRRGTRAENGEVLVNMGAPRWDWRDIPLSESRNTLHLGLEEGLLADPVAVSMGNPHMIFFVRDLGHIKLGEWGPKLEKNPLFPQHANVSAVQVLSETELNMAVWERGTGLTLACGSAACAAVVAGVRRGLCAREATVTLPGGTLHIEWQKGEGENGGDVLMRGPVVYVFEGMIEV